jgi:hypothetical protein
VTMVFTVMDNEAATRIRQDLEKLISTYKALKNSKTEKEMKEISEANVRADFIDRLFEIKVYALYGLTDEEIKMIEEQCKK